MPCVLEVTTFYSLEVTCVMLVSPDGCYQVIPPGQVAVKLSGYAGK